MQTQPARSNDSKIRAIILRYFLITFSLTLVAGAVLFGLGKLPPYVSAIVTSVSAVLAALAGLWQVVENRLLPKEDDKNTAPKSSPKLSSKEQLLIIGASLLTTGLITFALLRLPQNLFSTPVSSKTLTPTASPTPTAAQVVAAYCNGLNQGDYHTAYEQLANSVQSQETEQQFTTAMQGRGPQGGGVSGCTVNSVKENAYATFSDNYQKQVSLDGFTQTWSSPYISDCKYSVLSVTDNTATGTITTYDIRLNQNQIYDAQLTLDSNGSWKIDNLQAR